MSTNLTPKTVTVDGADSSSTGAKLSYTAPTIASNGAKRKAYVIAATWRTNTGTVPTVQLQIVTAATATIVLAESDSNGHIFIPGCSFVLHSGDKIQFNVTSGGAASTGDGLLSVDELV